MNCDDECKKYDEEDINKILRQRNELLAEVNRLREELTIRRGEEE